MSTSFSIPGWRRALNTAWNELDLKKLLTSAYKYLTLGLLGLIFLVMIGYVSLFVFFLLSSSWGAPVVLTPGHERVLLAQKGWLDLSSRIFDNAARVQAADGTLRELDAAHALANGWSLSLRNSLLREMNSTLTEQKYIDEALGPIRESSSSLKKIVEDIAKKSRSADELKAGLIDKQRFLQEKAQETEFTLQAANLTTTVGDLTARQRQVNERLKSLEALQKALNDPDASPFIDGKLKVKYDSLLVDVSIQDFPRLERSLRERTAAAAYRERRAQISQQLTNLTAERETLDYARGQIELSPVGKAFKRPVTVVFVPYSNMSKFTQSRKVYACRLFLLWCFEVGKVGALVDGEVSTPHPLFRSAIRGQFVEILITKSEAGKFDVLHVGGRPLLM